MRRFLIAAGAVIAASLTAIGAGAIAANPTVVTLQRLGHVHRRQLCDTGEIVNGTFAVKGTEWSTPNQADYRNTAQGTNTFTNPANGATVNFHFAGPFTATIVSFNEDGGTTELHTFKGLPEQIKTAHGGLLLRDAGYVQFLRTFDADDEMISSEVVLERGPTSRPRLRFRGLLRRHGSHARALKKHVSVGSRYAAPHPEIAALFVEEVRGDDPELASYLRIEEREPDARKSAIAKCCRTWTPRTSGRSVSQQQKQRSSA